MKIIGLPYADIIYTVELRRNCYWFWLFTVWHVL